MYKPSAVMKYRRPVTIVSCKCDVCGEEYRFSHDEEVGYQVEYDSNGGMTVCNVCRDEYEAEFKGTEWEPKWVGVPSNRIDYEILEPDYDDYD